MIREDAPLGAGSLQWFVQCDFQQHYFTLFEDAPETHAELARIALFDFVANNTDRKSGHVLCGDDGRTRSVEHELCFSVVFGLRTVLPLGESEPTIRTQQCFKEVQVAGSLQVDQSGCCVRGRWHAD